MNRACYLLTAAVVGTLAAAAGGQTTAPPLGPRYTDTINGFSIRRPYGSRVERQASVTELTRFNLRDPQSDAIRISMRLLRGAARQTETVDLRTYGSKLAEQLRAGQQFQIETGKILTLAVAGKQAVSFRGPFGVGQKQVYCRDVWIHTVPNRFLVVRTTGPLDAAEEVMRISDACIGTVKLFDVAAARAKHKADLVRGQEVLGSITLQSLGAAVAKRDYWLLIRQGEQWVGFSHGVEKSASRERTDGVLVVSEVVLAPKGGAKTFIKQEMYASFDRSVEKWETYTIQIDAKGQKTTHHEFGIKQKEMLLVQTVLGQGATRDYSRKVPIEASYVPQAMGPLLVRLIDRRKVGSYAFAQYNSTTRDFDMRTIEVVGPTMIDISGRRYDAVLLHDQMAIDAPSTQVYLDAAGLPLKVVSEDDAVLQQTTAGAVKAQFPAEWKMVWPSGGPS